MNTVFRGILAVLAGWIGGSIMNMGLILTGGALIPLPEGADNSTMEALAETMHLFEPKHFLFPFLAHAIGSLAGGWIAAKIARKNHLGMAMIVGVLFLVAGVANVFILPAPTWFNVGDLLLAYIPMAWIGYKLAGKRFAKE